MPYSNRPLSESQSTAEQLKTVMFSQPSKTTKSSETEQEIAELRTIEYLNKLFSENSAADILRIGFDNALARLHPLLVVSSVGFDEGVLKLISAGANVNLQNPQDGNTPLILATKGKHIRTIKILLEFKADLAVANQAGNNAFMVAIATGSPNTVNLLWKHRNYFDINFTNKKGYSALLIAAEKCWESCVNMLLNNDADKNLISKRGDSALSIAIKANDKRSVKRLLAANVKIIREDKTGDTPLCVAMAKNRKEMFDLVADAVSESEKELFVTGKLEQLRLKECAGFNSIEDFFINSLFPVLHKLLWHQSFRRYFQCGTFLELMIQTFSRFISSDEIIQRSLQLFIMIFHNKISVDPNVINTFISHQGLEVMNMALEFYSLHSRRPKQSATYTSLLLPIIFATTQKRGEIWLHSHWSNVFTYVQKFEKKDLNLHYEENISIVEKTWNEFMITFEVMQKERAELACAELLRVDTEEKLKIERKEKKKARRHRKKLFVELNNNASDEQYDSKSSKKLERGAQPAPPPVPIRIHLSSEQFDELADAADAADDEGEADEDVKEAKRKRKRRKRKKNQNSVEQQEEDMTNLEDKPSPDTSFTMTSLPEASNSSSVKVVNKFPLDRLVALRQFSSRRNVNSATANHERFAESLSKPSDTNTCSTVRNEIPSLDAAENLDESGGGNSPAAHGTQLELTKMPTSADPVIMSATNSDDRKTITKTSDANELKPLKTPRIQSTCTKDTGRESQSIASPVSHLFSNDPPLPPPKMPQNLFTASRVIPNPKPVSQLSHDPPVSWADLLKQKDFDKDSAFYNATACTSGPARCSSPPPTPSRPSLPEPEAVTPMQGRAFTLSTFIPDDIARRINGNVSNKNVVLESELQQNVQSQLMVEKDAILDVTSPSQDDEDDQTQNETPSSTCHLLSTRVHSDVLTSENMEALETVGSHLSHHNADEDQSDIEGSVKLEPSADNSGQGTVEPTANQDQTKPPLAPSRLAIFMDKEFPLGETYPLDPLYTNFLTDIRLLDIRPSSLDEVGFLSTDDDEFVEMSTQVKVAPNPRQKIAVPGQNSYSYVSRLEDSHLKQRPNFDAMNAAIFHYQSALWMQQRSGVIPPRNVSNCVMPYTIYNRSQVNFYNLCNLGPPGYGIRQTLQNAYHHSTNTYDPKIQTVLSMEVKLQNKQSLADPISVNPLMVSDPTHVNPLMVWQDNFQARRYDPLIWKLQSIPKEKLISKGKMVICPDSRFVIGKCGLSSSDSLVLLGMIGNVPVAVKRMSLALYLPVREAVHKLLQNKYQHEFLVKYLDTAEDESYGYIAQELCEYNLDECLHLLAKKKTCTSPIEVTALYKMTWEMLKGIQALHCKFSMLHRNLKPNNVLLDSRGQVKITDFGFTHVTPEGMTIFHDNRLGENCWRPKECINSIQSWTGQMFMVHYTMLSEIQTVGMLTHYILAGGQHPFGDNPLDIEMNISNGWPKWKAISNEGNHLVCLMLASEPRERPDITSILKHPFFWTEKRRYDFLVTVGSELADYTCSPASKQHITEKLCSITFQAVSRNWCKCIDCEILEDLDYKLNADATVPDLLMFLFFIHQSYNKLSLKTRTILGKPHTYFLSRFPRLFIPVYKSIFASDLARKSTLVHYFH